MKWNLTMTKLHLLLTLVSAVTIGCGDPGSQASTSVQGTGQFSDADEISKGDENDKRGEDLPQLQLDLNHPQDNVYAWRKTRASLDPEEDVIFYWQGYIYHARDKEPQDYPARGYRVNFEKPLFKFEGFNVARFAEDGAGGYYMVSREVSVYQDPSTGEIINCWVNQLLPDQPAVRVMHVANDPVNFGVGMVDFTELGDDVSFFSDILLAYRSPLADQDEFTSFSASDVYESNELFNFFVSKEDLANPLISSAPVNISWTRVGQYLPWMQMGDRSGKLIYHVRGYKVLKGLDAMPAQLVNWTIDVAGPQFLTSPDQVPQGYTPNATTWRVFREAAASGAYIPSCD